MKKEEVRKTVEKWRRRSEKTKTYQVGIAREDGEGRLTLPEDAIIIGAELADRNDPSSPTWVHYLREVKK